LVASVVNDLAVTPDGGTLVAAGMDSTVRFWDISGKRPQERNSIDPATYLSRGGPESETSVVFSKDGKRLATIQGYFALRWWDLNGTSPLQLNLMTGRFPTAVSPDGNTLLLLGGSGHRSWCDLTTDVPREGESFKSDNWHHPMVRLFPDGKRLAAATQGGEVCIMERISSKSVVERTRFKAGDGQLKMELSADGQTLAKAKGGTVKIWDVNVP
jgi:WD40 repeat protein